MSPVNLVRIFSLMGGFIKEIFAEMKIFQVLNFSVQYFLLTQFHRKFHTRGGLIFVPERCLPQESISALKYCKKFVAESRNFSANFPNVCRLRGGQWKTFVPVAALSLKLILLRILCSDTHTTRAV